MARRDKSETGGIAQAGHGGTAVRQAIAETGVRKNAEASGRIEQAFFQTMGSGVLPCFFSAKLSSLWASTKLGESRSASRDAFSALSQRCQSR